MTSPSAVAAHASAVGARAARKSRWPARLDWVQSASGLLLALFMWGHMFFVSSILLGKDAMWSVTRFFEGYFRSQRRCGPNSAVAVAKERHEC